MVDGEWSQVRRVHVALVVLLGLEPVPSFHDLVLEFFVEVERLHTVVDDAHSYVRQFDSGLDGLVDGKSLGSRSFCRQAVIHILVHALFD